MCLSQGTPQVSGNSVEEKVRRLQVPIWMGNVKKRKPKHSRRDAHKDSQGLWHKPPFKPFNVWQLIHFFSQMKSYRVYKNLLAISPMSSRREPTKFSSVASMLNNTLPEHFGMWRYRSLECTSWLLVLCCYGILMWIKICVFVSIYASHVFFFDFFLLCFHPIVVCLVLFNISLFYFYAIHPFVFYREIGWVWIQVARQAERIQTSLKRE